MDNDGPSLRHTSHTQSSDGSDQASPPGTDHRNELLHLLSGYKQVASLQIQQGFASELLGSPHCHIAPFQHKAAKTFFVGSLGEVKIAFQYVQIKSKNII